MKKVIWVIILSLIFGFTTLAEATLINRGGGLIYCDVLDLTLLQNANYADTTGYDDTLYNSDTQGKLKWLDAVTWAEDLTYYDPSRDITWDDWRLPSAGSSPDSGYNKTGSEMGHIYYTELGNDAEGPLTHTGDFINLQPFYYWSGTEVDTDKTRAWYFRFDTGHQDIFYKGNYLHAWAVRPGDVGVASVPEPAMGLLFLSLILGIIGIKRDQQRQG
jgi:hypothetical protein